MEESGELSASATGGMPPFFFLHVVSLFRSSAPAASPPVTSGRMKNSAMSFCTMTRQYVRTSILSHHMLLGNLGVLERLQSLGHATCVLAPSLRSVSLLHLCIKLRITTSTVEVFRIAACLCTASSDFLSGYHGCNMNNTFGQGGICDCFCVVDAIASHLSCVRVGLCALEAGGRQDPSLQPDHRGAGQGRPPWHLLVLFLFSSMCGQKLK